MTIAAGLIASRFVHYLALSMLFGGALFSLYGIAPRRDMPTISAWLQAPLLGAAVLALASGASWFAFTAGNMSGSLSGVADPTILFTVLRNTDFGRVWLFRLLLASGLVLLLLGRRMTARRFHTVLLGSLILLASIALTGHAGSDESSAGLRHRIADAFHLVAAGVWVGALVVFARLATTAVRGLRDEDLRTLHDSLSRFSGVGTIVVATLILSGILNPGFLSGLRTAYGQVLLAKLALFGAMLVLAAANRFWLTPRLSLVLAAGSSPRDAVRALQRSILAETALAFLVLAAVGWLGTLSPTAQE